MIRLMSNTEKAEHWTSWALTNDPFLAFRAKGQCHRAFLAVAKDYTPWFLNRRKPEFSDDGCAVIKTQKGGWLLVPRRRNQDERIALITACSAFRAGFAEEQVVDGEILSRESSSKHCYEIRHYIVRFTSDDGYLMLETGDCNRSSHGKALVFSWKGGLFTLPIHEYEAAIEQDVLFAERDSISQKIAECKQRHAAEVESRRQRPGFLSRIEKVNQTLKSCGQREYTLEDTYFCEVGYAGAIKDFLYAEENVQHAEESAQQALDKKALREACAFWQPQFKAATEGYTFMERRDPWGDANPQYYSNCVSAWSDKTRAMHYEYSAEGLAKFIQDLPIYEEEHQDKLRAEEKAEAERRAKEEAEEAERLAREAAAEKLAQAEAEAKELGLPGDIRIWHRNGCTNAGKGWVIGQNGSERDCDFVDTSVCGSNSKRYHQDYEGNHVWRQILVGELVILWHKSCTAAEHELEVLYRPAEITEPQLEHVVEILEEVNADWEGSVGLSSGEPSPLIDIPTFIASLR